MDIRLHDKSGYTLNEQARVDSGRAKLPDMTQGRNVAVLIEFTE